VFVETERRQEAERLRKNFGLSVKEIAARRRVAEYRASRASLRRRPPLVYGTARLVVGSTFLVQSIYGAIQEYARFDRPAWAA
jgi:hypothetical protein